MTYIYFETYGCTNNKYETEIMKGISVSKGYTLVDSPQKAEVCVINCCTVKGEANAFKKFSALKVEYPFKKFVMAGCVTERLIKMIKEIDSSVGFISTNNLHEIVQICEETINDNPVDELIDSKIDKINLPRVKTNNYVGIVPISTGCVGECAYCSVRLIKGALRSYEESKIIEEVKKLVKEGCKEIWITSQDNSAYMLDKEKESRLPELISEINKIDGDFHIRIGMMNPQNMLSRVDAFCKMFNESKVFKFAHIPLQSGSEEILKLMRRKYYPSEYKALVQKLRENVPYITIATDVIVGFPGETKDMFNKTIRVLEELSPDIVNISRFKQRENTLASSLPLQNDQETKKDRSRFLNQFFQLLSYKNNKKWIGWEGDIIVEDVKKDDSVIGRNMSYRPVIIQRANFKIGDKFKVKITNIDTYNLHGEVVKK